MNSLDISIQNVVATQSSLNSFSDSIPLAKGCLSVIDPDSSSKSLIISIETHSWLLNEETVFGTFVKQPNTFAFNLTIPPGLTSRVNLILPIGIENPTHPANSDYERFESLLIKKGLLLTGVRAAGNEIASSVRDNVKIGQKGISEISEDYASKNSTAPIKIDATTHSFVENAAQSTSTAASYTSTFASNVATLASKGGEAIGSSMKSLGEQVGISSTEPATSEARSISTNPEGEKESSTLWKDTKLAASEAGNAISQGATQLSTSVAQASNSTLGPEVNSLASNTGATLKNSGKAAFNAFEGTSVVYAGVNAAGGVREGGKADEKNEGTESDTTG